MLQQTVSDHGRPLLREARSVAQLRFPSIIAIHEVGTENGTPYLVCDFVEGITLADLLTSRRPTFAAGVPEAPRFPLN